MTTTITIRRELLEQIQQHLSRHACPAPSNRDGKLLGAELRAALAAPVQGEAVPVEDRGWPDRDYWCKCSLCLHEFTGHKRQVVCRVCSEQQDELATPPQPAEVGELVSDLKFLAEHVVAYLLGHPMPNYVALGRYPFDVAKAALAKLDK